MSRNAKNPVVMSQYGDAVETHDRRELRGYLDAKDQEVMKKKATREAP